MMNKKILFLILLTTILILPLEISAQSTFCGAIKNISSIAYQIGGSIIIIGWVIAGILYLTSAGSPEKTGTAKKAMVAAVIGTILIVIAGASTALVISALNWVGSVPTC